MYKFIDLIEKYDLNHTILLRFALFFLLIMHSVPGMLDGGVNIFGSEYLNKIGFSPIGVPLAWLIKLSHLAAAFLFVFNKKIIFASLITLPVMILGIILIHYKEGWFVVGGGRNGMEYNILIIMILLQTIINELRRKNI